MTVRRFIDDYSQTLSSGEWSGPEDADLACLVCHASAFTQRDGQLVCGVCGTVEEN